MKKLAYFSRLRRLLRAANDWTCDLPSLARKAQIKQETAYATVTKAVGSGDLPNAAISDDYSTLYLDDSLMPTAAKPAAAPQAEPAAPLTDAEQFRREGMDFLNYLKSAAASWAPMRTKSLPQCRKPARRSWALSTTTRSS